MMVYNKIIKKNLSQIYAIIKINVKLKLRFKIKLIFSFIIPIIGVLMPMIVLGKFFESNTRFGVWNEDNYLIYQFISINITLLMGLIAIFPQTFRIEKFCNTLEALIIAPFNRFNLLLGLFFAHLILISIPFTFFLILSYIYFPISIFNFFFVLSIFFLIALFFSGIGLILGVLAISKENLVNVLQFTVSLVIWFSCISYPIQIFPDPIQNLAYFNPFFYIFDALRWAWIDDNISTFLVNHFRSFIVLIFSVLIILILSVYLFNYIYKKFGIVGY